MKVLALSILLFFVTPVFPSGERARQAYLNKNYEHAKQAFYELSQSAPNNFSYQYNLGAAYYRLNEPILAKSHFLKALKLKPNDQDALFNIRLINKKLIDQQFIFDKFWPNILGINFKTVLTLMLMISAIGMGIIYFKWSHPWIKKMKRPGVVVLFIWGILLSLVIGMELTGSQYGMVVSKKTQVFSGPSSTQNALFYVHEGAEYKVIKSTRTWSNVQFPNGLKGWIEGMNIVNI